MATIITAARTIYLCDALLVDVYARTKEQRDEVAREDPAPRTIAEAVMVVARGQSGDLR